ncbi:MAG: elongation factor Tu [Clostridia bacterium]|nr:elongation factor Tu [Clostridia bacterium]
MRYVYSIETADELTRYEAFVNENKGRIDQYIDKLKKDYHVKALPEYVVLANFDMATKVHSDLIIPAYTNEARMVITPNLCVWKHIYLRQIDQAQEDERIREIKKYYEQTLHENIILQIIGHELAHHSELFLNDFDEENTEGLWFEEGMVEYISRSFFLTEAEFAQERKINQLLVALFEESHTVDSIESFGKSTYDGSYASIFFAYWKSFLLIDHLVKTLGSVQNVFNVYHEWHANGRKIPLAKWFSIE